MILFAAIDWHAFFFLLFSAVAIVFALGVLFSSNVVRMAFYLVLSLGATSGLFFLAGAEFVGAMQLMIYVGGTLVLLIFGVMLTAQSRFVEMKTKGGDWVLAAALGGGLLYLLFSAAFQVEDWTTPSAEPAKLAIDESKAAAPLGAALVGVRVDTLNEEGDGLGRSGYLLPFVIISVHLLVVLIGAGYMARTKRYVDGRPAAVVEAESVPRVRHMLAYVYCILGIIGNVKLAFSYFLLQPSWRPTLAWLLGDVYAEEVEPLLTTYVDVWLERSPWLFFAIGFLCLANSLLLFILLQWQRWPFYALLLVPFIQVGLLVNAKVSAPGLIGAMVYPAFLINTLLPLGLLYLLLRLGSPSTWSQLE